MMTQVGVYSDLRTSLTSIYPLVHEEKGSFFTVFDEKQKQYLTIMSANQPDMVIRLISGNKDTFDLFRVAFLVLS
jgi:hypothetical protein